MTRGSSAPAQTGEGEPDAGATAGRRPWAPGDREQVAVVSFSHTIQHMYVASLGVVYPFALADFHVSYAVLGVILGAAGVVGGLLQGIAGIVRRYSTRFLLGMQNLGMAVALGIAAVSPGIGLFAFARVFGTLASWPQHPVGSAHLAKRVPHRRGLVLAAHTTGGNVGTLVAPLIASAVIAAYSWRWALGLIGVLMALGSVITWTRVRPAPRTGPAAERSTPGAKAGATAVSLRQALRRRQAVAILVVGTITAAGRGVGVLTTYIPAYLRNALHLHAITIGVLVAVVSVGAVAAPMVGGHLSDRIGRRKVLYSIYALGALALAGFVLVGSDLLVVGLVGLCVGMFSFSEQPLRQSFFSDAMKGVDARAAFGMYFATQSVGALWITLLGFLVTDVGFRAAFFTMAGSFVLAGVILAIFARDAARPDAPALS